LDPILSRIIELYPQVESRQRSWADVAGELGLVSGTAARKRYQRWKEGSESEECPEPGDEPDSFDQDWPEIRLIFQDKKQAGVNWREILDLAIDTQDVLADLDDSQRVATVDIETDGPIANIYTADWHLGDGFTDHRAWKRHIELVLGHPGVFVTDLGDDRQNMRSFRVLAAVLGQAISPPLQARLMRGIVDELTEKNKLLAKVGGNHDEEFDERTFGETLQAYLLAKMKAPHFKNRGLLKLRVGNDKQGWQTYTNLLFHKSRFRSFLRKVHGAYREYQLSFPADVVAGGHDHEAGFELFHHYTLAQEAGMGFGGESFLIKCGTYQDSPFGWKYFHNGGFPWNAGVIYWPGEIKQKLFLPSIEDTLTYLDYLRESERKFYSYSNPGHPGTNRAA